MNDNLKSCFGFAWDTFLLFLVFMLIIALPAYAVKLPTPKAYSCEDKVLFVLQVIHAKQNGYTLEWIIQSVTAAAEQVADPSIKIEELILTARWAYTYKGSGESAMQEYLKTCALPVES